MREYPFLQVCTLRLNKQLALLAFGLSAVLVSCSGLSEQPPTPPPNVVPDLPAGGTAAAEPLPNTSTALSELYAAWQAGEPVGEVANTLGLEVLEDRVLVTLVMLDEASAQQAAAELPDMGAEVTSSFETMIDAWVPVSALKEVASLPGISLVREVLPAYPVQPY